MDINGHLKTTTLDYPKHLATTIFLAGCNFRCPFCHNKNLVIPPFDTVISEEDFFGFLEKRIGILEGVCITGGEATLKKELPKFIKKIKLHNLKVKLDTNGYNPDMLEYILENNLIDYIAMDIKNTKEKYLKTIGLNKINYNYIENSIKLICNANIPFEFRTTVVKEFHNYEDIETIAKYLKNVHTSSITTVKLQYFLQKFENSENQITEGFSSYSSDKLISMADKIKKYIPLTYVRGIY